jgi:hypothetical protein
MDGPRYSNTFSFYPWLLNSNYDKVATQSIAVTGINTLNTFQGHSSPAISFCRLMPNMIDDPAGRDFEALGETILDENTVLEGPPALPIAQHGKRGFQLACTRRASDLVR